MTPTEAKHLIESLANGIDPVTGEILPEQNLLSNPQLIRALFIAAKALEYMEKREQREKSLPNNAGKAWSADEDAALLYEFDAGHSLKQLAAKHGRTDGAIQSRLVRLGRIQEPT